MVSKALFGKFEGKVRGGFGKKRKEEVERMENIGRGGL